MYFSLRHYATSRKVAGYIPIEVIGFFNLPNPSNHILALRTETTTKNLPGDKGRPVGSEFSQPHISLCRLSGKYGILSTSQPYGPPCPVTAIASPPCVPVKIK
jgi:hypothetical protein